MISLASLVITGGEASAACAERLRAEFPTVAVRAGGTLPSGAISLDARAWLDADGFDDFDRVMRSARGIVALEGAARDVDRAALQVLTRYQRLVGRRNRHSIGRDFDRVLLLHARTHDGTTPLALADFDHALDTWQWMLRLNAGASAAAQMAAVLHDVERLAGEILDRAEVDRAVASRAIELVARCEHPGGDDEVNLLNDAHALSFFSLNSDGYLRYFGAAQTHRKVAYTLARLQPRHRPRLLEMRLVAEIARALEQASMRRA